MKGLALSQAAGPGTALFEDEREEDTQRDKFLTFNIESEEFGLGISHVIEIICIQRITHVPELPDFIKGVINLRGKVIPVLDMRTRFRMESRDYDDRTCIIVISVNEVTIGLIVDRVEEVVNIPAADIEKPSRLSSSAGRDYILGFGKVEGKVKILLNAEKLLFSEELAALGGSEVAVD